MAIIQCPECGKEVSDKTKSCIHCGYPLTKKKNIPKKTIMLIVGIIIILLVAFAVIKVTAKHKVKAICV